MIKNEMKHILLVEDQAVYAITLTELLVSEGYKVTHAADGEEAIKILKNGSEYPDLIIMDIILSGDLDGIEAARRILKEHDLPIIFHTSYTEKEIVSRTESIKNYGYVVKSTNINVLNVSIKTAFKLFSEKKDREKIRAENEFLEYLSAAQISSDETENIQDLLIQKDSMLNSVIESSPDIIVFALDKEYRYISYNNNHKNTMKQIWGADISKGINMLDIISLDSDRRNAKTNFDRALGGEHFILEEAYGDENLSRIFWVDYYSPLMAPDGTIIGLSCFVLNNTKQRQAEEQVKSLLKEKNIILKEVHHRIKNNMNIVYILLNVQAEAQKNAEAKEILKSAAVRIKSMMVLYEKLYQSESFINVSLKVYINSLMNEIDKILSRENPISIKSEIEDIELNANIASYIGIIINELTTNSIKHAFSDQTNAEIRISLTRNERLICLEYSDNGIGIPRDLLTRTKTGFGITLIKMLSEQLRSTLEILDGPGTKLRISFSL